jgi:hypothetical protein
MTYRAVVPNDFAFALRPMADELARLHGHPYNNRATISS